MDNPAFRERLHTLGLIVPSPERRTPDYLRTFVESEIAEVGGADPGERRQAGLNQQD